MRHINKLKMKIAKSMRRFVRKFKANHKTKMFSSNSYTNGRGIDNGRGINRRYTRPIPEGHRYHGSGKTGDYKY